MAATTGGPDGRARPSILTVEDDDGIRASLRLALGDEGYAVVEAADAESAMELFRRQPPDLVLVDIMLPGMDGLELCRRLRQGSDVPIIIVTARDDSHDVVAGLEVGADDYVTKPYLLKELVARIRALLRRARGGLAEASTLAFGDLVVTPDEGVVTVRGEPVHLTRTEFRLLCELAGQPRRVLNRDQLLVSVWGYDFFGDGRIVDAHVRRLRKKIEDDPSDPRYLVTVRGLGYKLDPDATGR